MAKPLLKPAITKEPHAGPVLSADRIENIGDLHAIKALMEHFREPDYLSSLGVVPVIEMAYQTSPSAKRSRA